jgi:hypothetical protein
MKKRLPHLLILVTVTGLTACNTWKYEDCSRDPKEAQGYALIPSIDNISIRDQVITAIGITPTSGFINPRLLKTVGPAVPTYAFAITAPPVGSVVTYQQEVHQAQTAIDPGDVTANRIRVLGQTNCKAAYR